MTDTQCSSGQTSTMRREVLQGVGLVFYIFGCLGLPGMLVGVFELTQGHAESPLLMLVICPLLFYGGWRLRRVKPIPASPGAVPPEIYPLQPAPVSASAWTRSDIVILGVVLLSGVVSVVSRLSEDYMSLTVFAWVVAGTGGVYVLAKMKGHWLKVLIVLLSWGLCLKSFLSILMKYGGPD